MGHLLSYEKPSIEEIQSQVLLQVSKMYKFPCEWAGKGGTCRTDTPLDYLNMLVANDAICEDQVPDEYKGDTCPRNIVAQYSAAVSVNEWVHYREYRSSQKARAIGIGI